MQQWQLEVLQNYKLIPEMKENHFENGNMSIKRIMQSPPKNENLIYAPLPTAQDCSNRLGKTSSIHPNYPNPHPLHLIHTGWLPSHVQPLPTRVLSPNTIVNNAPPITNKQKSFIEMGGNRQKRNSLGGMTVTLAVQEKCQQAPTLEYLNRKITILEGRIKELHIQKQMMAAEMNQKANKILAENQRLIGIIKDYQQKNSSQTQQPKVEELGETENEFNLEQMLESQINVNLELREEIERLKVQCSEATSKLTQTLSQNQTFQSKLQQKQTQSSSLQLALQKLQDKAKQQQEDYHRKIQFFQSTITTLEQDRKRRQTSIEQLVQEKQKRILELEQQNYGLAKQIEQNNAEIAELGEEVSSSKMQHMYESQELQTLKTQLQELSQPQQCKKCKELLHTLFRLNTQLNRK